MKRLFTISTAAAVLTNGWAAVPQRDHVSAAYRLNGQATGHYRETRAPGNHGGTLTSVESVLIFNRLGTKLEIRSSAQYDESSDGKLKGIRSESSSSQQSTHMNVKVLDQSLAITTSAGGKSYDRTVPFTGRLLGPEAARRLAITKLRTAGDSATYQTFNPDLGAVVTITDKLVAVEDGAVQKVEQTMSAMPGTSTLWLDAEGWLVRQTVPSPLGEIEAVRSDETASDTEPVDGIQLPPETFKRSIITANVRVPDERLMEAMRVKIVHKRPELGWPDFTAENQTVIDKTPNYVILEIRRPEPGAAVERPAAATDAVRPYIAANALLQSDDPEIQKIARSVTAGVPDAWLAARALQRWTNQNMHFDMGIAIAPASEVAKNRGGTCFGYSMLLGALARAAGIPSRVRMGLVYAGGIWGGHAWVDVRIGDQWIPIDGALYSPGAADAARVSFFTSSLEEGTLSNISGLAQLFGNVDIEIMEYTVAGKRTLVPADARPYTIAGDLYRNPWLGLSITKPHAFQFSDFDTEWPQTTLVAMSGPEHQRVEVRNESASLPIGSLNPVKFLSEAGIHGPVRQRRIGVQDVSLASDGNQAGLVFEVKGNVWLLTASGTDAQRLLEEVGSTIAVR